MWDNPRLLNATANALTALAALIFAYGGLQLLLRSPLFPLQEVVVRGEVKNANREEIGNALDGIGGNFFAVDLATVRSRLEQVGWVRRVDARRVWPDRIEVTLEEHVAFARWGEVEGDLRTGGFVNSFGEPFSAEMGAAEKAALPQFAGPAGTEGEVARRYRHFAELLAPLGEKPERVLLTPRHAWQLRLGSGLLMELGRDGAEPVEQRLERFVAAYPASLGQLGHTRYERVDLRYPNGFALRVTGWKG
jgi:cell division protein FtsQ